MITAAELAKYGINGFDYGSARLLASLDAEDISNVVHIVYGELASRAAKHLRAYWSDLYHDSAWLKDNCQGQKVEFWYAYDELGTHIGFDAFICRFRKHAVRVTVWIDIETTHAHMQCDDVVRPEGWRV